MVATTLGAIESLRGAAARQSLKRMDILLGSGRTRCVFAGEASIRVSHSDLVDRPMRIGR